MKFFFSVRIVYLFLLIFFIVSCTNKQQIVQKQKIDNPVFLELERIIKRTSNSTNTYKAALLLPLSADGALGKVARSMKDAAQLAVFEFNRDDFILLNYDTGKNSENAQIAVEKAIASGSQIIIGPLFAESTEIVSKVARIHNIPVISFTTKQEMLGEGVYALSYMVQSEINRMAHFALEKNMERFITMVPYNEFGHLSSVNFKYHIENGGGEIVFANKYTNNLQSKQAAVRAVAQIVNQAEEEGFPIDGIFVPEGGSGIRIIANDLLYHRKDKEDDEETYEAILDESFQGPRLLGISTWKNKKVLSEPSLKGGWFSDPSYNISSHFYNKFKNVFGYKPKKISSLSYDAVSIAIIVSLKHGRRNPYEIIEDPNGFRGTYGYFKFLNSGQTIRSMDVVEVGQKGALKKISGSDTTLY